MRAIVLTLPLLLMSNVAMADETIDDLNALTNYKPPAQEQPGPTRCASSEGVTLLGVTSGGIAGGLGVRALHPNDPLRIQYEEIKRQMGQAATASPPVPNSTFSEIFIRHYPDVQIASDERQMAALMQTRIQVSQALQNAQPGQRDSLQRQLANIDQQYAAIGKDRAAAQKTKDDMDTQDQRYRAAVAPFRAQLAAIDTAADAICGGS